MRPTSRFNMSFEDVWPLSITNAVKNCPKLARKCCKMTLETSSGLVKPKTLESGLCTYSVQNQMQWWKQTVQRKQTVHFQDFGLTFHLKSYHSMCIIPSVSLPSSWYGIWISEGTHAGAWLRLLTCTFSRAQPKICSQASKKHWFACRPFILLKEVPKASD